MASEHAFGSTPSSSQLLSACDQTSSPSSLAAQSDRRLFTVELACLLCGRALGVLESDAWPTYRPTLLYRAGAAATQLADWRCLRCATCGGAPLPAEVICRVVRSDAAIDWSAERPRRGRPPRLVTAQRRADSSTA
jgi:hypothetical protein